MGVSASPGCLNCGGYYVRSCRYSRYFGAGFKHVHTRVKREGVRWGMLVRRISLALLAFFLATASSFASICDVSCSFAAFHPVNHAGFGVLVHTNTTQIDHSCCRNRDQDQIAVPHLTMSPDCAVDPVLRLQLPMPPLVHGIAASVHGVQTIRFRPA